MIELGSTVYIVGTNDRHWYRVIGIYGNNVSLYRWGKGATVSIETTIGKIVLAPKKPLV